MTRHSSGESSTCSSWVSSITDQLVDEISKLIMDDIVFARMKVAKPFWLVDEGSVMEESRQAGQKLERERERGRKEKGKGKKRRRKHTGCCWVS